ncbi:unnamed protein product [Candida verbasci]|uniref:MAGE domain-containing protein n=1 Tax=Candida verbasci TaxID=1227364 RepID=A0A9W4TX90_9ASCO|nr:unnamed protein product [Candida verbasci]
MPKKRIPIDELDFEERQEEFVENRPSPSRKKRKVKGQRDSDDDYEENGETATPNNNQDSNGPDLNASLDDEIQHYVNRFIRVCLTKELKGQFIRKEQIRESISCSNKKISTDKIITQTNKKLDEIYGLQIIETPNVEKKEKTKKKTSINSTSSAKKPYGLVSTLKPKCKEVLGELWNKNTGKLKKEINSTQFFLPKYEKSNLPISNIELVKSGMMILIVCLIILNENHLYEINLIKYLKKFGISDSVNIKNSNISMNLQEFLKDLEARNYLNKEVMKGATEADNLIDYSLGRRSLIEFSPEDCFQFIKLIYGDDFSTTIAERSLVTIQRCYNVLLEMDNTNLNTNENSLTSTPTPQPM